ncbi:MAG: hypothetical protein HYW50_03610 [Candidatus Diapherotrites archaeon]|nr:hypothetical protein [Candidatus Diapherotrites archaeon]
MGYEHKNSKGQAYFLHSNKMKNGQVLHFFSKKKEGFVDLPAGYKVIENKKTGLPMVKKK